MTTDTAAARAQLTVPFALRGAGALAAAVATLLIAGTLTRPGEQVQLHRGVEA